MKGHGFLLLCISLLNNLYKNQTKTSNAKLIFRGNTLPLWKACFTMAFLYNTCLGIWERIYTLSTSYTYLPHVCAQPDKEAGNDNFAAMVFTLAIGVLLIF
jgi:vacuolar-type H+-ATPase subunit I/STV1